MKIKNLITQAKLTEAPGNGQATVTQTPPTLRGANQPFSSADIPSGMRNTLANGPTSRPGFAANTNREFVAKAGEMIGDAGATAEEIVASPWYTKWYKTFASGVKSVGGAGVKLIGKVALPLTVGMAMYEGYVQLTSIDKDDPNRRNKMIAIVAKLTAEYGFPAVAGYLGGLAGGAAGAFFYGIGAVPGAIIGDLAATAAAFLAQYEYGDDIDQAIEDLVDNVLMSAPAPTEAQPTTQTTYDPMGNVTGEEPITSPDATTASATPAPATRSATGTYTKPYDIKPNPLVTPNPYTEPVTDPAVQPAARPARAIALTPAQELARQTSTEPKPATAPAAASTPSGTPPKTPTRPQPVARLTPPVTTVPKIPSVNSPKKPTPPTAPTPPTTSTQPNYDDLTFKQAFARARERARELDSNDAGKYTFMWHGKPYQTNYKGSGTARKPSEPYIPQSKQRGMMSTAPINNPYENPKRKSINEIALPTGGIGTGIEELIGLGKQIAKLLKFGKSAEEVVPLGKVVPGVVDVGSTLVKDAIIGGKQYKYFDDVLGGEKYWYSVEKAGNGAKSTGKITKESDPALFDQLSKIRSAEADAARAAAAAGKTADNASASVASSERLTAKLSAKEIKALNDTDVELWTTKQLKSLGYNKSHVPMLSAARKAGINIVGTAEEMIASPWWQGWAKFTGATKAAFKGAVWFSDKTMNIVFWGWMAGDAVIEGFSRMADLDPNDPNYTRRVTEIWVEEAAKFTTEIMFWHVAGALSKWGLRKIGVAEKWPMLSELVIALSKGAGADLARKYAMQGGVLTGNIGIQDIVEMVSDYVAGPIDRSPGAGTLENTALYKKAYKWALEAGSLPDAAKDYAKMVAAEGPSGPFASQLDTHLPNFESVKLAHLCNRLDESTNARTTVHIHNMIKRMLAESSNPDVLERTAYAIQQSGILNEAGGIGGGMSGGKLPVTSKSNVVPFAKPGQAAAKTLPPIDPAKVTKFIKLPGMKTILKAVLWKSLPGIGAYQSGTDAWDQMLDGNWKDAFVNLGLAGMNIAQVCGYLMGGWPGFAAFWTEVAGQLYLHRSDIFYYYYSDIQGIENYNKADLEEKADALIKEIATQLVTQIANGAAGTLGINEDVDPNDNFMNNVTAAIAANTKGDKAGAQKALDAAKLNNPATGTDQTNQQKVLDQITKANPGLAIPKTNPNSTQTNVEEAGGIGGGISGGQIHGQAVGGNSAEIIQAYNEFAEKYPVAKFLLDIMPVTGTATSVIDASQDLRDGKYGQAALDMLGALPGFKIGKYLSRGLQNTIKLVNKGAKVANVGNAASNLIGKTIGFESAATVPQSNKSAKMMESPRIGDQIMLELADGRVIVAPISELRGNSMIVTLDETGHQWLDESPSHAALKIGDGTQSISSIAQFWNGMIDTLAYDTPAGWAQLFINLQNTTGHAARTMPKQWANIWRQQHIALGDNLTRGDMLVWIQEVEDAIDSSGLTESSHNPAGGSKLRKMLDSKDAAMLAVWMSSRAGNKGISVAKFAKDKAVQSGLPANHWWGKIKHLVNETADPYSMEKRYYIVRKTSSAAPVDGVSGFHQKSQAEKKLATMKNPDQYMVRAIDSTKLPKDEIKETRRSGDINFTPEDIAVISGITDLEDAKKHAIRLITRNSRRPMSAEKIKWFTHHINNSKSVRAITKMMYDMLLSGEGNAVIGGRYSTDPNSYRQTFKEDEDDYELDDDDEDDEDDYEEEMYKQEASKCMLDLYNSLTFGNYSFIMTKLAELGELYQEKGVYLPFVEDEAHISEKRKFQRITDLLNDRKTGIMSNILQLVKQRGETDSISNLLSVLDHYNVGWPELDFIDDLPAPAKGPVMRNLVSGYADGNISAEEMVNIIDMFENFGQSWPELKTLRKSASGEMGDLTEAGEWDNDTLSGTYKSREGGTAVVSKHPDKSKWHVRHSDGHNAEIPISTRYLKAYINRGYLVKDKPVSESTKLTKAELDEADKLILPHDIITDPLGDEAMDKAEVIKLLKAKMNTMDKHQRIAIKMWMDGHTFKEIGDVIGGVSDSRARQVLAKGIRVLSDYLNAHGKEFKHMKSMNEQSVTQHSDRDLDEAEYKGKSVPLSKPIRTSPSEGGKFKVYVKDPKTGNIKMVRFGDTTGLSIKRDDPARRKNYRARHHCENPGPKTKANYWSCKFWASTPVSKLLKGK